MLERFVEFWNNVTPAQRLVTVLIPLLFFWLIEYIIPLVAFDKGYKKSDTQVLILYFSLLHLL